MTIEMGILTRLKRWWASKTKQMMERARAPMITKQLIHIVYAILTKIIQLNPCADTM